MLSFAPSSHLPFLLGNYLNAVSSRRVVGEQSGFLTFHVFLVGGRKKGRAPCRLDPKVAERKGLDVCDVRFRE